MFFLSTLLNSLQVDVVDTHFTSLMNSLHSVTSYRYASQAHLTYISSLSRYGLLDNALFQEYLSKIHFISLYAIIFTSLHYHRPSGERGGREGGRGSALREREHEETRDTLTLPSELLRRLEEEMGGSATGSRSGTESCVISEADVSRLWESFNGAIAYMETMMRSGDNKELFMRLHFNDCWETDTNTMSAMGGAAQRGAM
jgi:hypothetical protein